MDEEGIIVGVKEHSPDFLQYLDGVKLILGTTVRLKKRYDYDHSLIVDVGGEELMVSDQVSQKLFIKKKGKN
jgi:DtxR family Mn-dependent transcriptional regulator